MCKLFVINSLYLGNRSLGYELYDGKGVVEMTEKQVRDGILAGKEIYGLKVSENGIDLEPDKEGFFMNNLVAHRHIGNYKPMYETENPVSLMYIVISMKEEKGVRTYEIISSRFEKKEVSEEMLKSLFLMGAVCGGAKVILKPFAKKIRRMLMKTQVEQIIEQEKLDAIAEKVAETTKTVTESVTTTVTKSVSENIARNLLKSGSSPEYVATATEMSLQAVLELQKNL